MRTLSSRVWLFVGCAALVFVACGDEGTSAPSGGSAGGTSGASSTGGGSGKGGSSAAGNSGTAGSVGAPKGGNSGSAGTSGASGAAGSIAGGAAGSTTGGAAGSTTGGAAGSTAGGAAGSSAGNAGNAGAVAGGSSGGGGAAAGSGGQGGTASGGGGAGASGDSSFAAPLKWAPPELVDPQTIIVTSAKSDLSLDDTKDYILVCDPATKGHLVTDRVTILGGHNVVMKGCFIQRTPNTANSVYPPVDGKCPNIAGHAVGTLLARGQTGVMYFEGIYVDLQNTTTNHQNYGVDAIDVGDADGRATLRLAGTATAGEKLTLTFANPLLQSLTPSAGFPRVIEIVVPSPASPESTANAIAAAITKDQAAAAVDVQIRATVKGGVVTFEQEMPHGNRTVTSLTTAPGSKLTTAFNRPDGSFRGVTYVFQNVRAANLWSTSCGHHADGIQNQSDLDRLYVDRFTAVSGYQGVQLQPAYNLFDVRLSRVNTRYLDPDCTHVNASGDFMGANGVGFWLGTGDDTQNFCAACAYTYQLDAVYAEERVGPKGSKCDGWAAYSLAPPTQATHGATYVEGTDDTVEFKNTLPPEIIGGVVKKGAPTEGDFVPSSLIVNAQGEVVYVPATTFQLASP